MASYFIDTEGEVAQRDEDGVDLADDAAARACATDALHLACENGDRISALKVTIRNEADEVIGEASAAMTVSWR